MRSGGGGWREGRDQQQETWAQEAVSPKASKRFSYRLDESPRFLQRPGHPRTIGSWVLHICTSVPPRKAPEFETAPLMSPRVGCLTSLAPNWEVLIELPPRENSQGLLPSFAPRQPTSLGLPHPLPSVSLDHLPHSTSKICVTATTRGWVSPDQGSNSQHSGTWHGAGHSSKPLHVSMHSILPTTYWGRCKWEDRNMWGKAL